MIYQLTTYMGPCLGGKLPCERIKLSYPGLLLGRGGGYPHDRSHGSSALAMARAFKTPTEVYLDRHGAFRIPTHTDLVSASQCGNLDKVRRLIDSGSDIEQRDANGCSALYVAALLGREEIARLLIECGADTDAATDSGSTPLSVSIMKRHDAISKMLLNAGAAREI